MHCIYNITVQFFVMEKIHYCGFCFKTPSTVVVAHRHFRLKMLASKMWQYFSLKSSNIPIFAHSVITEKKR